MNIRQKYNICRYTLSHGIVSFLSVILYCRKVQTESATGSVSSNKIRTTLTLAVKNIEFDTQACVLRVNGRNTEENQFVKVGCLTD